MLVLLDRDGVINHDRDDFIKSPDEFHLIEGSAAAVAKLNRDGHKVVVVSNQSGVGRGLFDTQMLERIEQKMIAEVGRQGGHFDAMIYCFDPPWAATDRRKPEPGMLKEALTKFPTPLDDCTLIGDSLRDLQAAAKMQIARILVRSGKGTKTQSDGLPPDVLPVSVCEDLAEAVDRLLAPKR